MSSLEPGPLAEDAAWLAAAARGDAGAISRLYDRFAPLLLAIGLRMLPERRDAEDLMHDVWMEVWRCAGDYDPTRGSVRVWLSMRMRSRALDRIRSAGRAPSVPIEEASLADRTETEDPSELADKVTVRSALAALPEEQRAVIELGYYGGLSSSEIAAELRIPIGTVKSRVAAAMKRLREALSDEARS